MCEIHPAVDADVIRANREKQQRLALRQARRQRMNQEYKDRVIGRAKATVDSILMKSVGVAVLMILMGILLAFDLISLPFVNFIASFALYWLAICIGAWLQYLFCERGYMK